MIGIIGAMEDEVVLLRSSMDAVQTGRIGSFEFYEGVLEGADTALLRCGIGKVNAAVGCALLIERFTPDFVINSGSAGGIAAGLSFGDVVVSQALLYHDVDVTAFGYERGQLPGQPARFAADPALADLADRAIDELKAEGRLPAELSRRRGLIASGDEFMHDPQRIAALRGHFPDLAAVEMEGAALAHTCALFGVPFLAIRALSDIAGEESPMKFDEFLPIAARHSGEIVRRIVRNAKDGVWKK